MFKSKSVALYHITYSLDRYLSALSRASGQTTDIAAANFRFQLEAWPNINRAGDFNVQHTHPESHVDLLLLLFLLNSLVDSS
jgi:hypothetical protein